MDIRVLIDEIIRKMGYRTYPGYPEEYVWVDHGDGTGEVIMLLESNSLEGVREFYSSTSSFPGEKFLFALIDEVSSVILSYCKVNKISFVPREDTAKMLGKAMIDMHLAKPKENGRKIERADDSKENRDFILVYLEEGNNPKYIRPAVNGEIVASSIGLKADLLFIPYYFFSYSMKVMEGGNLVNKDGSVMVNAVNGQVSNSINGYEISDVWPSSHRDMESKWEPLSSMEKAKRWISDSMETEVVKRSESDSFIIYTRSKVRPLEETVKITFLSACFYPIYSSSALVMDGFTGEIKSITDFI